MRAHRLRAAARVHIWAAAIPQEVHPTPIDSVEVESPLPGGVAELTRFLLNTVPPWVQIGGLILAALVGITVVVILFRRRHAIRTWLTTRPRKLQWVIGAVATVVLVSAGVLSAATWNYTQHSNDFCTGCHVMAPAFQKFGSEENAHAELSCHSCHTQPLSASARQLYMWISERPGEIGEHAPVPSAVCRGCHVTGDTATWQRIASTAGHRVHLESDSSALAEVQCVTCHGLEVHRFQPADETCGQSGCHAPEETGIVLGAMADQTVLHCTSCHAFTADVPALATTDSARGTLVPRMSECLGCHEMRRVLADFEPATEPHGGQCGTCHNPHEQQTPQEAGATCATAGCHANWRDEPFHVGASHRQVAERCLTCHLPHAARVDASNCEGCHTAVRSRTRLQPPMPFDTSAALERVGVIGAPHAAGPGRLVRPASLERGQPSSVFQFAALSLQRPPPARTDTFSHARHAGLACLVCHVTGTGQGRLTFERPRGCTICHHQAPATSRCASCHETSELSAAFPETLTIAVQGHTPNTRSVDFLHSAHPSQACLTCHTTRVTLAAPPAVAQCRDCHVEHHAVDRSCASCHAVADPAAGHATLEQAHTRCDACHTQTTVARLTPTRSFCATCHTAQSTGHYDERQCTTCHFLAEPGAYRAKLTSAPPP
jgi:hypothetical protein